MASREDSIRAKIVYYACEMRRWYRVYEKIQKLIVPTKSPAKMEMLQRKRNKASDRFVAAKFELFRQCRKLEKLNELQER